VTNREAGILAVKTEFPSSAASLAAKVRYDIVPLILSRQASTPLTYTTTPSSRLTPSSNAVKAATLVMLNDLRK